jgi:hypothetical protein
MKIKKEFIGFVVGLLISVVVYYSQEFIVYDILVILMIVMISLRFYLWRKFIPDTYFPRSHYEEMLNKIRKKKNGKLYAFLIAFTDFLFVGVVVGLVLWNLGILSLI